MLSQKIIIVSCLIGLFVWNVTPSLAGSSGSSVLAADSPAGSAFAQDSTPANNITFQPIGAIFPGLMANVEYERLISKNQGIAGRLDLACPEGNGWENDIAGLGGSYRFYPLEGIRAPRGLWYGPALEILKDWAKFEEQRTRPIFYSLGAEVGYKWLFGDKVALVVSPSASVHYTLGSVEIDGQHPDLTNLLGFGVWLGMSVGMAF